jgi:chitinase
MDWEYPVTRQGTPEDYDNYPLLVEAIRKAMTEASTTTTAGGKEYLLTMAVPVNPEKLDSGYHLSELAKYVDWFHLMSYDIHGSWDEVAGSNTDLEYIASTVENNILAKGVSGEQLVFGLASYGRSMVLTEPSTCTTSGCPISGSTMAGCSGESGFSPIFELKETYVDTGKYQSLLLNDKSASMEMILDGGIFVSLDIDQTFLLKRDYYLSK